MGANVEVVWNITPALEREMLGFLAAAPASAGVCFEHDPRWLRVLSDGLSHRPAVLLARGEGPRSPLRGLLPVALVKSTLFGRFLVSLPYLNRAGIVATDDAARAALFANAVSLANELDVQYLELRHHERTLEHSAVTDSKSEKLIMVRDLPRSSDTLWLDLDAKVRNQVRKGDKCRLSVRFGGSHLLPSFYSVFATNMRDLGTPVYAKRLFASVLAQFPDEAELAVVDLGGQPIAGALLVHESWGKTRRTQVPSASALRDYNYANANMWLYWQLLRRAIEKGSDAFDFGRSSPDSGTFRFKKQWGATPLPTTWQYHVRHGDLGSMRPEDPKMQRRIEQWKKLPVWVTRIVGPPIVRAIP